MRLDYHNNIILYYVEHKVKYNNKLTMNFALLLPHLNFSYVESQQSLKL